ncbi:hypothetical protein EYF80_054306 [Liparis tanakae]|uniref:Uncharacterized protein n=1 Tax=Liparis tanakae TaxID=230148 RepID=A0A4Z2F2Z2_9TELE|nr:hypothetical protein EYF80_054306 [Liparis tanakae]
MEALTGLYLTMYSTMGIPPSSCFTRPSRYALPIPRCPWTAGGLGSPAGGKTIRLHGVTSGLTDGDGLEALRVAELALTLPVDGRHSHLKPMGTPPCESGFMKVTVASRWETADRRTEYGLDGTSEEERTERKKSSAVGLA